MHSDAQGGGWWQGCGAAYLSVPVGLSTSSPLQAFSAAWAPMMREAEMSSDRMDGAMSDDGRATSDGNDEVSEG